MARVNVSIPDEVIAEARARGLNVSRVATAAIVDELDRRSKVDALDAYLAALERTLGPIPADESAAAEAWVDRITATADASGSGAGGRAVERRPA